MRVLFRISLLAFGLAVWNTVSAQTSDIESAVRNYYDKIMSGRVASWEVDIRRIPETHGEIKILAIHAEDRREPPRGAQICWVQVLENARKRDLPVTLTVKPVERVPVAVCDIEPRTLITPELMVWQEQPTAKYGAAHIIDAHDLNGAWAKVRIPAGTVLTSRRVTPMPKVVIGQSVRLVIHIGRIEASAEGKALQDGQIGEKIRVLNLVSGVRLHGRVAADGSISID